MDALIQKLIELVSAAGGSLLWGEMLGSLDYQERSLVTRAVSQARANGQLRRRVRWDAEAKANILTLEIPQTGGE
jgi:hypothetical protein